eukprot:5560441-Prymnesium_polylepis.1
MASAQPLVIRSSLADRDIMVGAHGRVGVVQCTGHDSLPDGRRQREADPCDDVGLANAARTRSTGHNHG